MAEYKLEKKEPSFLEVLRYTNVEWGNKITEGFIEPAGKFIGYITTGFVSNIMPRDVKSSVYGRIGVSYDVVAKLELASIVSSTVATSMVAAYYLGQSGNVGDIIGTGFAAAVISLTTDLTFRLSNSKIIKNKNGEKIEVLYGHPLIEIPYQIVKFPFKKIFYELYQNQKEKVRVLTSGDVEKGPGQMSFPENNLDGALSKSLAESG